MKQIRLPGTFVLVLLGCTKEQAPTTQCLPPPPLHVRILLRDAATWKNLLDAPARYRPDSIRTTFYSGTTWLPATIDTTSSLRTIGSTYPYPNSCDGSTSKTGRWTQILIALNRADTDTLTIDRPQPGLFEYRYNGQLRASRSLDSAGTTVLIEVAK